MLMELVDGGVLVGMFAVTIFSIGAAWYGSLTFIRMFRPSLWDYAPVLGAGVIVLARAPAVNARMQQLPVEYPESVIVDLLLKFVSYGLVALAMHMAAEEWGLVSVPDSLPPIKERAKPVDDAADAETQSADGPLSTND